MVEKVVMVGLESGQGTVLESQPRETKNVGLREECGWTALVEGDGGFQRRKQNKKKKLGREESKRKSGAARRSNVNTFVGPVWYVTETIRAIFEVEISGVLRRPLAFLN